MGEGFDVSSHGRLTRRRAFILGAALAGAVCPLAASSRKGQAQPATPQNALSIAISVIALSPELKDRAREMAELVAKDLTTTAHFAPLDPSVWRGIETNIDAVPQFQVWRPLGVRALAIGGVKTAGESLDSKFRLWDVEHEQALYAQLYKSRPQEWQRVAHITASLICERLIGEKRDFETP
jgi:TolB protein